uniref:Kinesin motor domain-containing protein n=1 Tax=Heterorhabditis bacteriophora TaxID=37862 RepID=A0A1I7X2P4_HETBA
MPEGSLKDILVYQRVSLTISIYNPTDKVQLTTGPLHTLIEASFDDVIEAQNQYDNIFVLFILIVNDENIE